MSSGVTSPRIIGRYAIYGEIASGGMATVHLGKLLGEAGFSRTVAIKRLHENFVRSPQFVAMMMDEARISSRIRHPNVVPTLDVVSVGGELFIVMEYVHGAAFSGLLGPATASGGLTEIPIGISAAIVVDALNGLHAAHEATDERGGPLAIIHRDVSPHNILVGADGVARVLDFGVAKAAGRMQSTSSGQIKGKLSYMAPEQMLGDAVDRRVDVYAAGVVLWEALAARRLFDGDNEAQTMQRVLSREVEPPSRFRAEVTEALDDVVMTALERDPNARFPTAHDFALALEVAVGRQGSLPRPREVGAWVKSRAAGSLDGRADQVATIDAASRVHEMHADDTLLATTPMPTPSRPRRRSARVAMVIGILSAVGLVGVVFGAIAIVSPARPSRIEPIARATSSTSTSAAEPPPSSASLPNSAAATPPPLPASSSSSPPPVSLAKRPKPAPSPSPAADPCNPPFVIDSAGVKVPKPACFK